MKKSLLFLTMALCGSYAMAQNSYHGFRVNATQELIDNPYKQTLSPATYPLERGLNVVVMYQPEYIVAKPNATKDGFIHGSTTGMELNSKNKMEFADYSKVTGDDEKTSDQSQKNLEAGKMDGMLITPKMEANGLMYLTVPEQYYKGGQLVAAPATGGDIRVRFFTYAEDLDGAAGRINDTDELHTEDINGIFATIDAPSTVKLTVNFVQANTTTTFNTGCVDGALNDKYDDATGNWQRTAVFELPSTKGNGPEDIRKDISDPVADAVQCGNLMKYARWSKKDSKVTDKYAFPLTCVDIVFYGVKPGEKVGWTNLQTLHAGYTPSVVESIFTEDANVEPEYYNLQGIKVANPENGIFIERRGNVSRKVVK